MKKKPYIRISRLRGVLLCTGLGCSGSGDSFREAWESWAEEMVRLGRSKLIPQERN